MAARQAALQAVVSVQDTGPGVLPSSASSSASTLDSGATRQAGGVGLGLYIARQLANAQGGEPLATDPADAGQGARFELRLPMAELPGVPVENSLRNSKRILTGRVLPCRTIGFSYFPGK